MSQSSSGRYKEGCKIVNDMLLFIGEDPKREGLKRTPHRVVKMWDEIYRGYNPRKMPRITRIKNGSDGIFYNKLIIDHGYFFSHCEHHCVPFFGQFFWAYIPDEWLIGASKIDRVVDYCSARLQIAERLVHNICDILEKRLNPKGMMLVMKGRHLCKEMRGVKKFNSPFEVNAVRGCFLDNKYHCKEEFLSRIK